MAYINGNKILQVVKTRALSTNSIDADNITDFLDNYARFEYIETTGTQYIDTGIIPSQGQTYLFSINFYNTNDVRWFGYYDTSASSLALAFKNNYIPAYVNNTWYDNYNNTISTSMQNLIKVELSSTTNIYCNDVLHKTINAAQATATYSSGLMTCKNSSATSGATGALYYCVIYDYDELVRFFVPCYRLSDNEIGMYDLVNGVFYTNAGTGSFNGGY